MTAKPKFDAAQEITNEIIALLEKGTMPWRRPWKIAGGGVPLRHNGEPYKGINAFLLGLRAATMGYSSPYWVTFAQAKALGASVRKGSKSSVVVYYGTARKRGAETRKTEGDADGDGNGGSYRFLKSYRVFHVSQVEGLDASYYPDAGDDPAAGPDPIPEVQAFFDAIDAEVVIGGDRACYIPSLDRVHIPALSQFKAASGYYATLFHEIGHWTKAPHRLDRSFGVSSFGNESYAKEELCVELAAVLGGQQLGFCPDHIENHAAYIGSWLKVLKSDSRFLFTAAAHAQRIVDYLVTASAAGTKQEEIVHEAA